LGSTAPEQLVAYVPTALDDVAVVVQVGSFVSEDAESPFSIPRSSP